jgi:PEP-CTERM motif
MWGAIRAQGDHIMKSILLAGVMLAALGGMAAQAATPLRVTGSDASGSDPVSLNESNAFNIADINNGATINGPLTVYFAVPVGQAAPSVTSYSFDGGPLNTSNIVIAPHGTWTPSNGKGGDLYSFVGCAKCDASINASNVDAAEFKLGFGANPNFAVFSLTVAQGFGGNKDFETFNGAFDLGTIIAPLAENIVTDKHGKITTTYFDTSWTNAGLVNMTDKTTLSAVPEPSTWAMLGIGFAGLAGFGLAKRKKVARALEA